MKSDIEPTKNLYLVTVIRKVYAEDEVSAIDKARYIPIAEHEFEVVLLKGFIKKPFYKEVNFSIAIIVLKAWVLAVFIFNAGPIIHILLAVSIVAFLSVLIPRL